MAEEDIELRREQFRWQRQRFTILLAVAMAMAALVSTVALLTENVGVSRDYADFKQEIRDIYHSLDRNRKEADEGIRRELELARRLDVLDTRQQLLEEKTDFFQEKVIAMSELIEVLRAQVP